MENSIVRVSIGNLVWTAVNTTTGEVRNIAFLNPKARAKGHHVWSPLGGGAMLTIKGKKFLERDFSASDFELDPTTGLYDLRCKVEHRYVERIFSLFEVFSDDFEYDASTDAMDELKDLKLFTPAVRATIRFQFEKSVRQRVALMGTDTSLRAATVPTHRLFRIYSIHLPDIAFEKLFRQKYVRTLTPTEIATTDGGLHKGNTIDGDTIQNNIF